MENEFNFITNRDNFLKFLCDKMLDNELSGFTLSGGAVADIYSNKIPNDYDFIDLDSNFINKYGTLICVSDLADTYHLICGTSNYKVQILKNKDVNNFDFTINANTINSKIQYNQIIIDGNFHIEKVCILTTTIKDCLSFKSKLLIPISYEPEKALQCLKRLPHMIKDKGFINSSK